MSAYFVEQIAPTHKYTDHQLLVNKVNASFPPSWSAQAMPTNINKLVFAGDVIDIYMWPSKINGGCGKNNKSIRSKNHTTFPCLLHHKVHIISPHECCIAYCLPPFNLPLRRDACTYLVSNDRSRSMEVACTFIHKMLKNMWMRNMICFRNVSDGWA